MFDESESEHNPNGDPLHMHITSTGVDPRNLQATATSMSRKFFLTPPERLQVDQSVNLMDCETGQYDGRTTIGGSSSSRMTPSLRQSGELPSKSSSSRRRRSPSHQQQQQGIVSSLMQAPTALFGSSGRSSPRARNSNTPEAFVDEEMEGSRRCSSPSNITKKKRSSSKQQQQQSQPQSFFPEDFNPNQWEDRASEASRQEPLLSSSDNNNNANGSPKKVTNNSSNGKKKRRGRRLAGQLKHRTRQLRPGRLALAFLGLFLILVCILAPLIAMGEIGWMKWNSNNDSNNNETIEEDDDLGNGPAFMPARNHSYLDVMSLPKSTQTTLLDKASRANTPQHQALEWIDNDPLVGILATDAAEERLGVEALDTLAADQRFVLATLYYATNGAHWSHASFYYDDVDDEGNDEKTDQHYTDTTDIRNHHDSHHQWLDIGLNECDWFGLHPLFHGNYSVCNRYHQLHALKLRHHNLTGTLPMDELGLLQNLKHLDLAHNALQGTLSTTVWKQWKNIESLDLASNDLVGSLPTELGHLTNSNGLSSMVFKYNALTGTIPTQLGLLVPRLTKLDVVANELTGTIPTELGGIMPLDMEVGEVETRALTSLALNGNHFTGLVPSELGLLSQLTSLGLHSNFDLTPQILPDEICQLQRNGGQLQKLAIDCGIVTCPTDCACTCESPWQSHTKAPSITTRRSKSLIQNGSGGAISGDHDATTRRKSKNLIQNGVGGTTHDATTSRKRKSRTHSFP